MILQLNETDKTVVANPKDVAKILQRLLRLEDTIDQEKEHFYAIHLDTRSRIKLIELVAIGIVNASLVHPREIFRRAIAEGATAIIVAHNHPSNNPEPSAADIEISKRVYQAGEIIGIELLDHIIFTQTNYQSLKAISLI